jgi:predicted Zn-dependent peptidase
MVNDAARPLRRERLDNGLDVILHRDPALPLVAVNLWYHVGSKHESRGRTGLAHLFEHMLFQGSEHVGTNDHFRHLQSVGGVANGSTWYDRTNYYETVPAHQLDLALWLESDRMGFLLPALDQQKLETQREVVSTERRQRVDNQPYGRPYERLFELLFPPEHPYSWPVIGTLEDIAAATLDEVRGFFRRWYVPDNAVLTLAGDFDPDDALRRIERWFGAIPPGAPPPVARAPLPPLARGVAETVEDSVQLPRIYLAFRVAPVATREWFAVSLLASLLTDGKSSPLYYDLVYRRQIAQDVTAYVYPTEEVGILLVVATAKPGIAPAQLSAALREHLDRAAAAAPDERDFARARNTTLAGLFRQIQTLDHRADELSMYATFFDRPELAWEEPRRYRELEPAELTAVARERLGADRAVELTVVPKGTA